MSYIAALVALLNHCLNNSYFPAQWKTATIIPIPQKGGIIDNKDFRPTSLTSNLGKLLENAIIVKLKKGLKEGTIPHHQFGFKKGHSTCDALGILDHQLRRDRRLNKFTGVCSLDIKKAFDSVWHDGLIFKVWNAGCDPHTVKIIGSFLDNRRARVKCNNTFSEPFKIERGVPQGSKLGPILYNIYIGDLKLKLKRGGNIQHYADDTLIQSSTNAYHAIKIVGDYCSQVIKFLDNWGIELNC